MDYKDFGELLHNGEKCCNGYRWKHSTQMFEMHILQWTANNKRMLENREWKPKKTNNFTICERGKKRDIKAHHIGDRQVYKSYNKNEVVPLCKNSWVPSNSASQVGKGTEYAIKTFKKDLSYAFKKCKGNDFYVVIYDFHNYFGILSHDIIMKDIGEWLDDNILQDYVGLFENGVGIGGELSQTIAITYTHKMDRYLLCSPCVLRSGRFMDDGYCICATKEDAKKTYNDIYKFSKILKLQLNDNKTKIVSMKHNSVEFLKKRTKVTSTGKIVMHLNRKSLLLARKRLKEQKAKYNDKVIPLSSVKQSFHSYCSYALKYNSYNQVVNLTNTYSNLWDAEYKQAKKCWRTAK